MTDVLVIGGGIAGLSAANALADRGARVLLVEAENALATQASGNNAAIFRPLEERADSAAYPRRSRELLRSWAEEELLEPTGLLLLARELSALRVEAGRAGLPFEWVDHRQLRELAPSLEDGDADQGLLLRDGGVLDVPRLTRSLEVRARRQGAELRSGVRVRHVARDATAVTGAVLADGEKLLAPRVVLAAGAWNVSLGEASNLPLPLLPLARHLLQLTAAVAAPEPVVWRLDDEVYYRREGAGVLASPCDEQLATPGGQQANPAAPRELREKLERLAPVLARGSITRSWACLRTFAADRELVLGEDPRARGLYWFAGLGGRGMCVAPAAAEMLASLIASDTPGAIATNVSPARLLAARKSADRTA